MRRQKKQFGIYVKGYGFLTVSVLFGKEDFIAADFSFDIQECALFPEAVIPAICNYMAERNFSEITIIKIINKL